MNDIEPLVLNKRKTCKRFRSSVCGLAFLVLISLLHCSEALEEPEPIFLSGSDVVSLDGTWYFHTGPLQEIRTKSVFDSTANFDFSTWELTSVPGQWNTKGLSGFTEAYYARFIYFDKESAESPALRMPITAEAHEVYLNGKRIAEHGQIQNGIPVVRNNSATVHRVPESLIYKGRENILMIRVSDDIGWGGFLPVPFQIGPENKIVRSHQRDLLWNLALALVFYFIGTHYLILFLARRKDISYFHYGLFSIIAGTTLIGSLSLGYLLYQNYEFNHVLFHCAMALIPSGILNFLYAFFGISTGKLLRTFRIVSYLLSIAALLTIFNHEIMRLYSTVFINIILFMIIASITISLFIITQAFRNKQRGSLIILTGYMLMATAASLSILDYYFTNLGARMYVIEGFLLFNLSMAIALAFRLGSVYDETERLATEMKETNIQLSQIDQFKDQILANTSHELKTPLTGIIGITDALLGEKDKLDDQTTDDLMIIRNSAHRLSSLVNDLLDSANIQKGYLDINLRPHYIDSILHHCASIIQPQCTAKRIHLKIEKRFPPGLVDPDRLSQVLLNLLGNAVKFTENGQIRIHGEYNENTLTIRISDSGIGIAEADQKNIFQPFFQVDGTISRKFGGVGLGLSISKNIIEKMNGSIEFYSEYGYGSTFSITLPRSNETPEFSHLKNPPPTAIFNFKSESTNGNESRILIVDDELSNLQVLERQLNQHGLHPALARNGLEAMKWIEQHGLPNLIVLDVMMPEVSGIELTHKLRKYHEPHELPIIMLTARTNTEDIIQGLEAGANDYLTKPFDHRELLARIETHLLLQRNVNKERQFLEIENELQLAGKILNAVLPERNPKKDNFNISIEHFPAYQVGGDYYDYHTISEQAMGFFIADVSGHGVSSALIASMLRIAFSTTAEVATKPSELIESINSIMQDKMETNFLTCSYVYIDRENKQMICSNAGHPPGYIIKQSGEILEIGSRGRAIGITRDLQLRETTYDIGSKDRIILFTDGITECRNFRNILFLDEGLLSFLYQTRNQPIETLGSAIISELVDWTGKSSNEFEDDITFVAIEIT